MVARISGHMPSAQSQLGQKKSGVTPWCFFFFVGTYLLICQSREKWRKINDREVGSADPILLSFVSIGGLVGCGGVESAVDGRENARMAVVCGRGSGSRCRKSSAG